jgi:CheY-like chemotaxis protein
MPEPITKPASRDPQVDGVGQESVKLLVVENDRVYRTIIERLAAALGFQMTEADSYDTAIELLDKQRFDCITLDLSLRAHNAIEVLRHLWTIGRRIPVLIVSGSDEGERCQVSVYAQSLGFQMLHIAKKPADATTMHAALGQLRVLVENNNRAKLR